MSTHLPWVWVETGTVYRGFRWTYLKKITYIYVNIIFFIISSFFVFRFFGRVLRKIRDFFGEDEYFPIPFSSFLPSQNTGQHIRIYASVLNCLFANKMLKPYIILLGIFGMVVRI